MPSVSVKSSQVKSSKSTSLHCPLHSLSKAPSANVELLQYSCDARTLAEQQRGRRRDKDETGWDSERRRRGEERVEGNSVRSKQRLVESAARGTRERTAKHCADRSSCALRGDRLGTASTNAVNEGTSDSERRGAERRRRREVHSQECPAGAAAALECCAPLRSCSARLRRGPTGGEKRGREGARRQRESLPLSRAGRSRDGLQFVAARRQRQICTCTVRKLLGK